MITQKIRDLSLLDPITFKKIREEQLCWIWISQAHKKLFFSWEETELGIYEHEKKNEIL